MGTHAVWDAIIDELAGLQDREVEKFERPLYNPYTDEQVGTHGQTAAELEGAVENPVCGYPITFDTACAAAVFAGQCELTGGDLWRRRAVRARRHVLKLGPYGGVAEPRWDPVGWHFQEGSLFATGVVLDSLWSAAERIEEPPALDADALGGYLEACRHGEGRYAHNEIPPGAVAGDVQNTTAIALFLRNGSTNAGATIEGVLEDDPSDAVEHLTAGQRSDGHWPYIYPGHLQQLLYRNGATRPLLSNKIFRKTLFRGDSWILMGDSAHHCYVLYYLLRADDIGGVQVRSAVLEDGWNWIRERLVETEEGYRIDFSWEPGPDTVRFCNFYDTTTYFYLLAILPLLARHDIEDSETLGRIGRGLLAHVEAELLDVDATPCLPAHECSYDLRRLILPAVWGGVALKGALLARYLTSDLANTPE